MTAPGACKHDKLLVTKPLGAVRGVPASHNGRSTGLDQAVTSLALWDAYGGMPALPTTSLKAAPMLEGNQLFPQKELTIEAAQAASRVARFCRLCHLHSTSQPCEYAIWEGGAFTLIP